MLTLHPAHVYLNCTTVGKFGFDIFSPIHEVPTHRYGDQNYKPEGSVIDTILKLDIWRYEIRLVMVMSKDMERPSATV